MYSIPDLGFEDAGSAAENAALTACIDRFMSGGALPGSGKSIEVPESCDIIECLRAYEYVEEVSAGRFRLSSSGLSALRVSSRIAEGQPALAVRDVPIRDMTAFEAFAKLLDDGWVWKPAPSAARKRAELQYTIPVAGSEGEPSPKFFYTGRAVITEYLQCLLLAPELSERFGCAVVPHYGPQVAYAKLLEGKPWVHA